ncbi:MAG: PAS domain S-box protein [Gemmatimonadaceae bacterium]|nr:PAS domain S-box protein [Gemmatimonadaceae bacterium]
MPPDSSIPALGDATLLELFFSQSLTGAFFMMIDEPVAWDAPGADHDTLIEYVFAHQRITRVNDAMLAQFGASRDSFLGRTPADFFAHDPESARARWKAFLSAGQSRYETDERRLDGTAIRIEGEYIVLRTPDGRVAGHFGVQRDVTERHRAETALRESEARYEAAFRLSPFRLTINRLDDGRFIEVNDAFLRDLGRDRGDVIGRTSVEMGLWADPTLRDRYIERLKREKTIIELEFAGYERHGRREITRLSSTLIELQGVPCVLTIAHDVTDRYHAELQLESSQQQLRALSSRQHQVREEERRSISREIHDELGQVLTGVKLDVAWAHAHLPPDATRAHARLAEALERIAGALEVVRRIATTLRPAVLDDIGLVAAIEWLVQQFAKRTGVRTTLDVPPRDPPLSSDARTTVFRIVQEALTNVARHAEARSAHVVFRVVPDSLTVSVRDDGRGITDGEMADTRSLGLLGLRERAIAAGGTLTIRGRARRGTTVTLHLPIPTDAT